MSTALDDALSPNSLMNPRSLGALQPTRLSASRSFIAKMIRENWTIEKELLELDSGGNGRARYSITTPQGLLTFLAYLREPAGGNRTSRIIGTSWDMIGSLIDGVASPEQVQITEEEIPKLYEGRAPEGTFVWFRSNQSLRIFRHVRDSLARGVQPNILEVKKVGYLMRNTGLDGNGTFGTTSFPAIPEGHSLKVSYHAQMLAAYLMRELAIDVVEELARIDAPETAVALHPSVKQFIGVGNGSALGLVMFVYNRPVLINAYISAYTEAVKHVLTEPSLGSAEDFSKLEALLDRTIRYRALDDTVYRVFAGSKEIAADLRRIRVVVRAARRGDLKQLDGETLLGSLHRHVRPLFTREAVHSFNALLLELVPDYCDRLVQQLLVFDEHLDLNLHLSTGSIRETIERSYRWALEMPLNDEQQRDRVWYQSRAAEEPRSGPREEIPGANEVIPGYSTGIKKLLSSLNNYETSTPVGKLVAEHPELEHITRLVVALADKPYAVPHADPHDADFVPVWLVRLMNSFIHGVDRTEDYLNRTIRGLIFEGAPFRDELSEADPSDWWWSYRSPTVALKTASPAALSRLDHGTDDGAPSAGVSLKPKESAITARPVPEEQSLTIKYREARLMSGRAYQALNVPEGSWHGAREFFITALLGSRHVPDAFGKLLNTIIDGETGEAPEWRKPSYTHHRDTLIIDNHGQSLLSTGHVLVNLIGAHAAPSSVTFRIDCVQADEAVEGLRLGLARYGVQLTAEISAGAVVSGSARRLEDPSQLEKQYWNALDSFMQDGLRVSAQTFWNIYHRGNVGLYPDTPISRQHTGATVMDVLQPGQKLTKQFSEEELLALTDPDDADVQDFNALAAP